MGAYEGLSNYFNQPLYEYAIKLGYDESNILILQNDIHTLQIKHHTIYQNLISCQHHSDKRSPIEYGKDLIASWIFEDYFLKKMQFEEFNITLSGADRTRIILPNQKTSTISDYIIHTTNGNAINMELMNDYTGFWFRNCKLHLRDNKYLRLKANNGLLLAIALSPNNYKYTLLDFRKNIPATKINSHRPFGGKSAYELPISLKSLYDFNFKCIKKSIISTIGGL